MTVLEGANLALPLTATPSRATRSSGRLLLCQGLASFRNACLCSPAARCFANTLYHLVGLHELVQWQGWWHAHLYLP